MPSHNPYPHVIPRHTTSSHSGSPPSVVGRRSVPPRPPDVISGGWRRVSRSSSSPFDPHHRNDDGGEGGAEPSTVCRLRSDHDRAGGYVLSMRVCVWVCVCVRVCAVGVGPARAEVLALPNASEVLQALEVSRAVEAYEPKKRVARAADGYFWAMTRRGPYATTRCFHLSPPQVQAQARRQGPRPQRAPEPRGWRAARASPRGQRVVVRAVSRRLFVRVVL